MEQSADRVVIPKETVEQSEEKKRRHRTLRQMPIYRDMANLKYLVVMLYQRVPKKLTRYIDSILLTVCESKKCVGMAHVTRNAAERMAYLDMARVMVEDVQDDITIVKRMNLIDKDTEAVMKRLAKSVVAQAIALRDSTYGQDVHKE
jgi:hypothetical protein